MGIGEATNVTTGKARLSYVHLFKPYAAMQGQEEKFSVTVLIPKTDVETMARINAAIEAAKQKGITEKWNGVCPPIVPTPVYDGDGVRPSDGMPFGEECKGHWVFTASAKVDYPPEVVDKDGKSDHQSVRSVQRNVRTSEREFLPLCIWRQERNWMWTGSGSEVGRWGNPVRGTRIRCTGVRSATAGISNTATKWGSSDQSHHRTSDVIFCGVERLRMFKRRRYG